MGLVERNRQILARWSRTKRMFELLAGKILRSDRARCHMLVRFSYYVVKILCELLTSALRTSELDWTGGKSKVDCPSGTIVSEGPRRKGWSMGSRSRGADLNKLRWARKIRQRKDASFAPLKSNPSCRAELFSIGELYVKFTNNRTHRIYGNCTNIPWGRHVSIVCANKENDPQM